MPARLIIGGGIGTGKSAVCLFLAQRGFEVLEADRVGHAVLAEDPTVVGLVALRWPETLVEGSIHRARLARIVFEDPAQLRELEAITHPTIRHRIRRWANDQEGRPAAVEIPVLADLTGPGWKRITVDAPAAVRIGRLRGRGMSGHDIETRMASQPTRKEWLTVADVVLDNSGTPDMLEVQVDSLVKRLAGSEPH